MVALTYLPTYHGAQPHLPTENLMTINLEDLPLGGILAIQKLVTDQSPVYREARELATTGATYRGELRVLVTYDVSVGAPGKAPAKPLDPWAVLAAIHDLSPHLVERGARNAHYYEASETQTDVRKVAKDASLHTWTAKRKASKRMSTRVEISELSDVRTVVTGGAK